MLDQLTTLIHSSRYESSNMLSSMADQDVKGSRPQLNTGQLGRLGSYPPDVWQQVGLDPVFQRVCGHPNECAHNGASTG